MMLDADVQTGIVVDRNGAVQGLLTVEAVAQKMREGEHAPAFDQAEADGSADLEEVAAASPGEADLAAAASGSPPPAD
jgi:Mg2+/Co2+ transporter CorC